MRLFSTATLIVAAGVTLAGCASAPTEEAFNARIAAARASPEAYKKEFDECMQKSAPNATQKQLDALGAIMNTPPDRALRLSCERFTKAVVSGRITYKQYAAQFRGIVDPEMIRVIQGR